MAKEQSNEIELAGFCMPSDNRLPNAASSLMPGHHYSNNMSASGIVKRLTLNPSSGVVTVHMETTDQKPLGFRLFVFPTGMTAEEKKPE